MKKDMLIGVLLIAFLHPLSLAQQSVPETAITAVIRKWNDAHSSKDMNAFSEVYAPQVGFYCITTDKAECLTRKKELFRDNPGYAQTISGKIDISKNGTHLGYIARFRKKVTVNGAVKTYPSYLILGEFDDVGRKAWKIVSESDDITDANMAVIKRSFDRKNFKSCEDVIEGIFKSAQEVRSSIGATTIFEVERKSDGFLLHLYSVPPMEYRTFTSGWFLFDTDSKILKNFMTDERIAYDSRLLPDLAKFCK